MMAADAKGTYLFQEVWVVSFNDGVVFDDRICEETDYGGLGITACARG